MDYSLLITGVAIGMAIGILATIIVLKFGKAAKELSKLKNEIDFLAHTKAEQEKQLSSIRIEKKELNEKLLQSREENAGLRQRLENAEKRMIELKENNQKAKDEMQREFQLLANKIFEEKSDRFDKSSQKTLDAILSPLKEKIKAFEDKVEKIYNDENKERINLKAEVKQLTQLNKQLSQEANNLTTALKGDNKRQGNWGEMILEKVLESSGLEKNREYTLQYSEADEYGKPKRPDVVVNLPDSKHIIIDAKVSLLAYEAYSAADEKEKKEKLRKEHILSLKNHIKGLSEKNYQGLNNLNSPDFVLLFMPIEGSLGLAAQADNLWTFAWERKIVLVSPSTLLATLRTVASIWKHENQNLNAIEIATQAGKMLDKFTDFSEDMIKIGKQMETTKGSYDKAMNKLVSGKGNLIRRSEELKRLGVKAKKTIDQRLVDRSQAELLNREDED